MNPRKLNIMILNIIIMRIKINKEKMLAKLKTSKRVYEEFDY